MKIEVNTTKFVAALKSVKEILKQHKKDKIANFEQSYTFASIMPVENNSIDIMAISLHMATKERLQAVFLGEEREPMRLNLPVIEKILTELKEKGNWIAIEDFIKNKEYFIAIENSCVFKVHDSKPAENINYDQLWDSFKISLNPQHFFPLSANILKSALNVLKTSDYSGQPQKDTLYHTFFLAREEEKPQDNGKDNTEALLYKTYKNFRNLEVIQMQARNNFETFYN